MPAKFEDLVTILKTTSMWGLGKKMPQIIEGLEDALKRIQALEAAAKAKTPTK